LRNAQAFDGHDTVDLDLLLAFVERIVPRRDGCMRAIERAGRKLDVIESRRCARDEVAMRGAIRDERIGVHIVDEFADEVVVLPELIGEGRQRACERRARNPHRQPADQPRQSARCVGAIHLSMINAVKTSGT